MADTAAAAATGGGAGGGAGAGTETAAAAGAETEVKCLYEGTDISLQSKMVADPESTLGGRTTTDEPSHPGLLRHLLTSLRPGQDLTRVTIPSFYLEDRSLLEKLADVMMHPQLLMAVPKLETPLERMKQLCKWYLSGWHYKTTGVKKPYNPVIGETYACAWKHDDGSTSQYFAEQVSHRPPVSALYFENRKNHLVINSQVWTKSKFKAPQTAVSILVGGADVHVLNHDEVYRLTFPSFYAHGLLIGTLRMEIGDSTSIICEQSQLQASFDFHQKPMFGGSYCNVSGKITDLKTGKVLYEISGKWNESFKIKDKKSGKSTLFLDVQTEPMAPKYCLPVNEQGAWESRRLWNDVTEELQRRPKVDWTKVDTLKLKLEDAQRELETHKSGAKWDTKKFHLRPVYNAITKETEDMYTFDDMRLTKYEPDEEFVDLIWLSARGLPDIRDPKKGDDAAADATATAAGDDADAAADTEKAKE